MKFLILSVSDKRHMSMISVYESFLFKENISYDIIRVNRYVDTNQLIFKEKHGCVYEFPFLQSTSVSKINKIIPFLKFRKFVLKILKEQDYSFIIVWNENTAVLFFDILFNKYKKKFCLNIRDIVKNPIYNFALFKLVSKSLFSTLPSPARVFTNMTNVFTLYNRDIKILKNVPVKTNFKQKNEKLNVTFMGLYNSAPRTFKKIAKIFANDERFVLHFYGDGFELDFKSFLETNKINNVVVGGVFPYEKTFEYLVQCDIINSYYDNFDTNPSLPYASGVKQSYTPLLYIPAINDLDTTWGKICQEFEFSYLVNNENFCTLPNDLYNWYHSLNFDKFKKNCDLFNRRIDSSINQIYELLKSTYT